VFKTESIKMQLYSSTILIDGITPIKKPCFWTRLAGKLPKNCEKILGSQN